MKKKMMIIECIFEKGDYIILKKDVSCEENEIYIDVSELEDHNGVYINEKIALEIIDFLKTNILEKGSK